MEVLVAGVGNVLRGDDGFGVAVAQRLLAEPLPRGVRVIEVGIGGIHLVQELLEPRDVLVVVDAVDLGRAAGTVAVLEPDVRDFATRDELADMHYATPERAFMLARGLSILPRTVRVVGCQPADSDRLGQRLSAPVAAAVETAVEEVRRLVREVGIPWPE